MCVGTALTPPVLGRDILTQCAPANTAQRRHELISHNGAARAQTSALHSLSLSICERLLPLLRQWEGGKVGHLCQSRSRVRARARARGTRHVLCRTQNWIALCLVWIVLCLHSTGDIKRARVCCPDIPDIRPSVERIQTQCANMTLLHIGQLFINQTIVL